MATNQGFKNVIVSKTMTDAHFLYYWISLHKHVLLRLASGSTFVEVPKSSFEEIAVLLPPLPEQRAIAAVLSIADAEIRALQSQTAALERQKKGLMQKLLTGEVRVK
jgi:type I restriction enzyme S subunit